jgi:hypothetical protein
MWSTLVYIVLLTPGKVRLLDACKYNTLNSVSYTYSQYNHSIFNDPTFYYLPFQSVNSNYGW